MQPSIHNSSTIYSTIDYLTEEFLCLDGAEWEVLLQVDPGGRYDEVGVDVLPTLHLDSPLRDVVNVASDDGGLALPDQAL